MALVSVVIPTRGRPHEVVRAIKTVLAQTMRDFDVMVIIDGPDKATIDAVKAVPDCRIQWRELEESVGGAEARNIGIREATGKWIALLDDDDEWLPTKLEEQLHVAGTLSSRCFVTTRFIDSRPNAAIVQPGSQRKPNQAISEYLFAETSMLGFRNGFMQTSTWLVPREVMLEVPFTKGLPRNQETDWLIRAIPQLSLEVGIVWKTLVVFHNESSTGRITSTTDWQNTLGWAIGGGHFTPKALAFFVATVCIPGARLSGEPVSVFWDLRRALKESGSRFTFKSAWLFFAGWFVFPYGRFGLRSKLQNLINSHVRHIKVTDA